MKNTRLGRGNAAADRLMYAILCTQVRSGRYSVVYLMFLEAHSGFLSSTKLGTPYARLCYADTEYTRDKIITNREKSAYPLITPNVHTDQLYYACTVCKIRQCLIKSCSKDTGNQLDERGTTTTECLVETSLLLFQISIVLGRYLCGTRSFRTAW